MRPAAAGLSRPTADEGRRCGRRILASFPSCPIPEIARLGRTLRAWRVEFLAYHDTAGASNGPTEAMNLLIERGRRDAHGFRNFDNRLRLLLACGVGWQTPDTAQIRSDQNAESTLGGVDPDILP